MRKTTFVAWLGADVTRRRRGDVTPVVQVRGRMKNEKEHRETTKCTNARRPNGQNDWVDGGRQFFSKKHLTL